jgi:hypothetical protein
VQRLFPTTLALRRLERHDQIGGRGEAHLVAVLGGQVAECDCQVRFADTGWTEKDDVLGALDKGQAGELVNLGRGTPAAKPKSKPSSVLIVGMLRDKRDEHTYCRTGECSRAIERCLTMFAPVASSLSARIRAPFPAF